MPIAFGVYSGCSASIDNNIVSNATNAIWLDDGTVVEDYDVFYESGISGFTKGAHGDTSNPEFVKASPVGPMDVKLQSKSPAIHSGESLSSTYKEALDPASTSFPCSMLDQTKYVWSRGAFGSK